MVAKANFLIHKKGSALDKVLYWYIFYKTPSKGSQFTKNTETQVCL